MAVLWSMVDLGDLRDAVLLGIDSFDPLVPVATHLKPIRRRAELARAIHCLLTCHQVTYD